MNQLANPALEVQGLSVSYRRDGELRKVVHDVSLTLIRGQLIGLAGESGSGKSTTGLACVGYRARNAVVEGRVLLGEDDLLALSGSRLQRLWGSQVAYLPQDAAVSLTPTAKIGRLFDETLRRHSDLDGAQRTRTIEEMLDRVGMGGIEGALRRYPFEFSGGQQQRLALALALICRPRVLILDEPTTGVDVTTQAVISTLIRSLVADLQVAVLYISHDLALLRSLCDSVAVMYAGEIVESADSAALFERPRHPYTAGLLDGVPQVDAVHRLVPIPGLPPTGVVEIGCAFANRCRYRVERCTTTTLAPIRVGPAHETRCLRALELPQLRREPDVLTTRATAAATAPVLSVETLDCWYRDPDRHPLAVTDASLELAAGEILAIAGESGSGKSTLLRTIVGLHEQARGGLFHDGQPLPIGLSGRSRDSRRELQLVPQHSGSSLNPRHTIRTILNRPLTTYFPNEPRQARHERLRHALDQVQLSETLLERYPHELSGGQQQRVAIARALAVDPRVVLCDEIVSALDVSVQAAILELIRELRDATGVAFMFVTHDLAVVRAVADEVIVMQSGAMIERGPVDHVFDASSHDYTRLLLAAAKAVHTPQRPVATAGGAK
jgi:peptide/nickel transport system ATP-binding protein